MSHKELRLKIDPWDEGASFVPALKQKRGEPRIHPGLSLGPAEDQALLPRTLKPVGFYVAYSYTLFRKGDDPRDPLYALF